MKTATKQKSTGKLKRMSVGTNRAIKPTKATNLNLPTQPTARLETITPDYARELLGKNWDNRNLRDKTAQRYGKLMADGKWELNSATIGISKNGKVLDGQHRLRGIVYSNKPLTIFVIYGLEDTAFGTIDVGLRRSPADILTIQSGGKVRWPTAIAAALRIVNQFESDGTFNKTGEKDKNLTSEDLVKLYKKYPDIQENLEVISQYKNVLALVPHSVATALYTVMMQIDEKTCMNFWESFDTGANLTGKSPVLALQKRFVNYMAHNGGKKVHRRLAIAMIVKAWNARRKRRPLEKMAVDETQPIIIQ